MKIDYSKYLINPLKSVDLAKIDPADTQGIDPKKGWKQMRENRKKIIKLQEKMYAEDKQSVLLVFQAMDAAGKDSTIKAVTKGVNPQGCVVTSFKKPSSEELDRDFLWRIHKAAPRKGNIRIFNRSHYEDVLIAKVHGFASKEEIEKRYEHINNFEKSLADQGTRVIKIMLHISKDYQLSRFRNRLENPDKWWKFNPGDLDERQLWGSYMDAFEKALKNCSTDHSPWYVIPAENKWFRCLAVSQILLDHMVDMNPKYPEPDFDPKVYRPETLK